MNGYFNIYKPAGMSSAAVVGVLRRLTGEKRVGHAGTLDPQAAGVLPVMTGKATRLFDYLTDKEKEYVTVVAFGSSTDTQDATGTVLETGTDYPTKDRVLSALPLLTGDIRQRPSMYSAIKVDGKRLYQMARKGQSAEVPERIVHIERIELLREMAEHCFELRITCGRGTYIRTICHDLGRICGCPAHMKSLIRTRSGYFTSNNALTLDEARQLAVSGELRERLIPPDMPLAHLPATAVPPRLGKKVAAGAKLCLSEVKGDCLAEGEVTRVYLDGSFWGMAERKGEELVWRAQIAPEEVE